MRLVFMIFALLLVSFGALIYWIKGPERIAQAKKFVPNGLRVIVVDLPGDPNVISYAPDLVTIEKLETYARRFCGHSVPVTDTPPSWIDNLTGRNRA